MTSTQLPTFKGDFSGDLLLDTTIADFDDRATALFQLDEWKSNNENTPWGRKDEAHMGVLEFLDSLVAQGDEPADAAIHGALANPKLVDENPQLVAEHLGLTELPDWVDKEAVARGQKFYWKHGFIISVVLLFVSLAGGYGVPRIDKVLQFTNYINNKNPKLVWRRLLETAKMVNSAMDSVDRLLEVGGEGWKEVVRVRLLHTRVRRRIWNRLQDDKEEDQKLADSAEKGGEGSSGTTTSNHRDTFLHDLYGDPSKLKPINQADMINTIMVFQAMPLLCLQELGIPITRQEVDDYTHTWRVIAHIIGCTEVANPCQWGYFQCLKILHAYVRKHWMGSPEFSMPVQMSLGDEEQQKRRLEEAKQVSETLMMTLLTAVGKHGTRKSPMPLIFARMRLLQGDRLSDCASVPAVPSVWKGLARVEMGILFAVSKGLGWKGVKKGILFEHKHLWKKFGATEIAHSSSSNSSSSPKALAKTA